MTYKDLKNKIKEEQKSLAQQIREKKRKRKDVQYGYVEGLDYNRDDYRHIHIAYCQFFNQTPYGLIEQKCYDKPRKSSIESHIKTWESQIDEAIRDCA
jgi:hypothetical protein